MWTGAGPSACLDLALALVAADHGQDVALRVARQLVIHLKRPGGQRQLNVSLDPVSTVMGQTVVRNHASDGVLIKDFTEPGGLQSTARGCRSPGWSATGPACVPG